MHVIMKWAAIGLLTMLTGCSQPNAGDSVGGGQDREHGSIDLTELISSGAVSLVRASGTGASSGNSIDAV